jgi:hypothetical protein
MIDLLTINGKEFSIARSRSGGTVGDSVFWTANCVKQITEADAIAIQEAEGYGVGGYGFGDFKCKNMGGMFRATWTCAANCD